MTLMESSVRRSPCGQVADVLHWPQSPPSPSPPRVVVLFVPGNPGLPQYYIPFLEAVQRALSPSSCAVYALGHLGHSAAAPRIWTGNAVVGLRGQVEDKVSFVDELDQQWAFGREGGAKLVVIGHSIGSWVICEMVKLRSSLIDSCHLLFPTISHMSSAPNGLRMSPLFSPRASAPFALATSALSFLPASLLQPVIAVLADQRGSPHQAAVTTSLVQSPGVVVAAFTLAREELNSVKALDRAFLVEFGARLRWYWAAGEDDGWVADSSVVEIQGVLDGAGWGKERQVRCAEGMVHAFVLTEDHVASLALKCAGWIRDDCILAN